MVSFTKRQSSNASKKVLKRATTRMIARRLQVFLALANFKINCAWEDLDFDAVEAKVNEKRKQMRQREDYVICNSNASRFNLSYTSEVDNTVCPSNGKTNHLKSAYMGMMAHMTFDHANASRKRQYFTNPNGPDITFTIAPRRHSVELQSAIHSAPLDNHNERSDRPDASVDTNRLFPLWAPSMLDGSLDSADLVVP
ncbi:uncharacterized protein B0I36DRAFT_341311 [Microdochium trichocladiopsis]|uniref:Uncharacterized protein n=1 Tax=Microdochium trichocladiopsis TaxID=1682393 RepID=A0A9P8XQI9_9PEZI|nr:uncharacterized protein B0I36DRAFT_341311 [Microdochium trichocladiopsis]KAH7010857.1 hypothetical protein B0I36DRAFT_341311 [Microdochium trichocladiopsis]